MDKVISRIEVFRAPQYISDLPNAWYFCVAGDREFCWKIFNPSGEQYIDRSYIGMGEQRVITPEQAAGSGRQTLTRCALYTAKKVLARYGQTVTNNTEVVIR